MHLSALKIGHSGASGALKSHYASFLGPHGLWSRLSRLGMLRVGTFVEHFGELFWDMACQLVDITVHVEPPGVVPTNDNPNIKG